MQQHEFVVPYMPSILSMTKHEHNDARVLEQLNTLAIDQGYWDFRRGAMRDAMHGVTQYPAMMVPAMQGKLLDVLCDVLGPQIRVIDPFIGSGTTLVETMRRGLDFWGQDINPLAILISLSKTGPFNVAELDKAVERVHDIARSDRRWAVSVNFPGRDKWFTKTVLRDLSRIRRAIQKESNLWVRRMLWVALAETVRLTSNSRTSTFKLHVRSKEDLAARNMGTIAEFHKLATDAVQRANKECSLLEGKGFLHEQAYEGTACVKIGHSGSQLPGNELFDLLITSPPYGDGASTVPYGQYSFLPLQWIDFCDISADTDASFLESTHEIDSRALGGSRRDALKRSESAAEESPTLRHYLATLSVLPPDRCIRVASFFADFLPVLDTICERMRPGAYMVWTVGNRSVGGITQPLDAILTELLQHRSCHLVEKLERAIPSKRMASRNSTTQTMRQEQVLIMRTGDR